MQSINFNNQIGLIFSVSLSSESANVNELRTNTVREVLKERDIPFVDCIGSYKGIEEKSFLVVSKDKALIQDLIDLALMEYIQESVLIVEGQHEARLWNGNEFTSLGVMREVSLDEAKSFEAYTVRLDNMKAYVAQKTQKLNNN